jgi:DNA-binding NtrC family response regulator
VENKPSILIVDDNASLCRTMSLVLERRGYEVTMAGEGAKAIQLVNERPFDIIFMDIKMPAMDGVDTYKRVKKIRPDAIVVMMTGYAVEDLVQEALREGAYGVVYKPLDMDRVVALIERTKEAREGALILVADDDPGTCATLKNILATKGFEVSVAHTSEEAIARARERTHELVLIDVKLPTLNGLETYLAIREVSPDATAIMMTGYRDEVSHLVQEAMQNNAYTCLYKPLDMAKVLEMIDEILKRRRHDGGV